MTHPVLAAGNTAVITGGASGIGLACAKRLVSMGLTVCIADHGAERLERAAADIVAAPEIGTALPSDPHRVVTVEVDVRHRADLERLAREVTERFGGTDLLMNNAGIGGASSALGGEAAWRDIIATNLWGVIHGSQVFAPGMLARGRPGVIVNTGSKQGITTPPGNPAYNVAKAGVKVFTEALAHELRNRPGAQITAHLLIPGYVFTDMTGAQGGTKPEAAWTPEQLADFFLQRLDAGDFYILCPDNEVSRALDERRILWAAGDIVENRPALSRWHPDFEGAFKAFVEAGAEP